MPRPRTTNSKREREIRKRMRDQRKKEKAELKQQRREAKESESTPGTESESGEETADRSQGD